MELEYVRPADIERRSFEIIGQELSEMGIILPREQAPITMRVIHTTADFEYAQTMVYSEYAVEKALELLRGGANLVTDTNMALAGVNKRVLATLGGEAHCYMADETVAAIAKAEGRTRASVSMDMAMRQKEQTNKPLIIAAGNAPTALVRLRELIDEGMRPDLIIGVPVGFVNVEASKELIMETNVPYIINRGRKGGSGVAAAICNALLYMIGR